MSPTQSAPTGADRLVTATPPSSPPGLRAKGLGLLTLWNPEPCSALLCRFVVASGGSDMPKHCNSNHSLWPEQARPRRAKSSALAIGGFCIGIVAAISANNVLTELLPSSPTQEAAQRNGVADIPIYATAPAPAPKLAEPANPTRSGLVAKLPSISTLPTAPSVDTDGRGGATDGRSGEAPTDGTPVVASTTASTPLIKATDVAKPADEPLATTSEPKAKPAARERPARMVQKKRKQPTNYASRNRNGPLFPFFGFGNGSLFGHRG
jgi:hypothetical protein